MLGRPRVGLVGLFVWGWRVSDFRSPSRAVQVTFGGVGRGPSGVGRVGVCMLVVRQSPDEMFGSHAAGSGVRVLGQPGWGVCIEHTRFRSSDGLVALPGLDHDEPSLLRDAVACSLSAGAPAVDIVAVRVGRDATGEDVLDQILAYLPELTGGILCIPDLRQSTSESLVGAVQALGPFLSEFMIVACLDVSPGEDEVALSEALMGADVALCAWTGRADRLGAHGWRSAAAVVAGVLAASTAHPGESLLDVSVALPPGRVVDVGRLSKLTVRDSAPVQEVTPSEVIYLRLDSGKDRATVESEPVLRMPVGTWTLPSLLLVKRLHRAVVETAAEFTFRPVTDPHAFALTTAMIGALYPFVAAGLLVGSGGKGVPEVTVGSVRDPLSPGFLVDFVGVLQPWSRKVEVRVRLHGGSSPEVSVT